jgi:single-stranded DNA-binding protein
MMRRCAMSSIAKVTIVGHIGSASKNEVPNKDTGEVIVVNRQSKNGDATDWYECSLYNRKGFEVDWLTKGKQVMVEGQLSLETYTTKAGEKGVSPKVRVNDVVLLGKKE